MAIRYVEMGISIENIETLTLPSYSKNSLVRIALILTVNSGNVVTLA